MLLVLMTAVRVFFGNGEGSNGESTSSWVARGAAEAEVLVMPSGFRENGLDLFTSLRPILGLEIGEGFAMELGPTFRLRMVDTHPTNRAMDYGGVLRRADWDELSDFGQILRHLRIEKKTHGLYLEAGQVHEKTLGFGHVINRYSNQKNPNYHPAMGDLVVEIGPVRGEFFASDILSAHLFATDIALDLGRLFEGDEGRYRVAFEVAAAAELPLSSSLKLPQVTLFHLDASAKLVELSQFAFTLLAGMGTRFTQRADLGFLLGTAMDVTEKHFAFSAKFEARKQAGGFRHGFFGPMYELSRYVDVGLSGAPVGAVLLPDSFSFYGELSWSWLSKARAALTAEYFLYNRLELDATAVVMLLDSRLTGQARFTIVGLGQGVRYHATVGFYARLFSSFYLLGSAGTVFFPQSDGTLLPGVTASIGVGVDFEHR